jgi:hypothetical protein
MLCMMYWELNEDMPTDERLAIAGALMESGMFPPDGAKVVGWWGTPDNWGILLVEAENAEAAFDSLNVWRNAGPGMFTFTKTAPAMEIKDSIEHGVEMLQKMEAAMGSE